MSSAPECSVQSAILFEHTELNDTAPSLEGYLDGWLWRHFAVLPPSLIEPVEQIWGVHRSWYS